LGEIAIQDLCYQRIEDAFWKDINEEPPLEDEL
jgi:hypothetical protein